MKLSNRLGVLGALLAIALLGGVTWVYAQEGAEIYACYNNHSGEVKIVGRDDVCKRNETRLEWNIMGRPGPPGVLGFYTVHNSGEILPQQAADVDVLCNDGDTATGATWSPASPPSVTETMQYQGSAMFRDEGTDNPYGWRMRFKNGHESETLGVNVRVVCAHMAP